MDKKLAAVNWIEGRGKFVIAEDRWERGRVQSTRCEHFHGGLIGDRTGSGARRVGEAERTTTEADVCKASRQYQLLHGQQRQQGNLLKPRCVHPCAIGIALVL